MTAHEMDQVVVLEPRGDLYEGTRCDEMESALLALAERGRRVVVDLSGTHQITARCLGILAHAHEIASRNGGRVVLCGAGPVHRWLLAQTGLAGVLAVLEDATTAVRELDRRRRVVA